MTSDLRTAAPGSGSVAYGGLGRGTQRPISYGAFITAIVLYSANAQDHKRDVILLSGSAGKRAHSLQQGIDGVSSA